jgi:hypothetical protein
VELIVLGAALIVFAVNRFNRMQTAELLRVMQELHEKQVETLRMTALLAQRYEEATPMWFRGTDPWKNKK